MGQVLDHTVILQLEQIKIVIRAHYFLNGDLGYYQVAVIPLAKYLISGGLCGSYNQGDYPVMMGFDAVKQGADRDSSTCLYAQSASDKGALLIANSRVTTNSLLGDGGYVSQGFKCKFCAMAGVQVLAFGGLTGQLTPGSHQLFSVFMGKSGFTISGQLEGSKLASVTFRDNGKLMLTLGSNKAMLDNFSGTKVYTNDISTVEFKNPDSWPITGIPAALTNLNPGVTTVKVFPFTVRVKTTVTYPGFSGVRQPTVVQLVEGAFAVYPTSDNLYNGAIWLTEVDRSLEKYVGGVCSAGKVILLDSFKRPV